MSQFLMFKKLGFETATYPPFCTMSWNILFFFDGVTREWVGWLFSDAYFFMKKGVWSKISLLTFRKLIINSKWFCNNERCKLQMKDKTFFLSISPKQYEKLIYFDQMKHNQHKFKKNKKFKRSQRRLHTRYFLVLLC